VRWPSPFFLELGGGAMLPIWRDRVFLEPDMPGMTIHQVPPVGFLGEIAIGVEFADRNRN
jgi:hypothetical protein